jgi:hypothetical protein
VAGDASNAAVLANVVRTRTAGGGTWMAGFEMTNTENPSPTGRFAWSGRNEDREYSIGATTYAHDHDSEGPRDVTDGSGALVAERFGGFPHEQSDNAINGQYSQTLGEGKLVVTGQVQAIDYSEDFWLRTTAPDGAIELNAPALGTDGTDVQVGNVATPPNVQAPRRTTTHVISSAALATPLAPKALKAARSTVATATPAAAAAPIDTTPVTIEVLAAYTQEQVTLRGSAAAVQTEFANLIAIANQAHIDSGSRVRLHAARTYLWGSDRVFIWLEPWHSAGADISR